MTIGTKIIITVVLYSILIGKVFYGRPTKKEKTKTLVISTLGTLAAHMITGIADKGLTFYIQVSMTIIIMGYLYNKTKQML